MADEKPDIKQLHELAKSNAEKIDVIHSAIVGTIDGKPGILPRLEKLEAAGANRSKLEWAGLLALLGLIGMAVWDVISK